jgi:hypothetical protein
LHERLQRLSVYLLALVEFDGTLCGPVKADRANSRKFRWQTITSPAKVSAQAATETHNIACDTARNGEKSDASERRRLASEYIPSGNTRAQNSGV